MFEYWKSTLSANEVLIYEQMYEQCRLGGRRIVINCVKSATVLADYFHKMQYDHPELYQVSDEIGIGRQISLFGTETCLVLKDVYRRNELAHIEQTIQLLLDDFLDKRRTQTVEQTIRMVVDWFVDHVTYQLNDTYNQNAAAALCFRKAQCSGIAKAFKLVMDEMEIPCIFTAGMLNNGKSVSHAWNLVQLNGAWYHVDVTGMLSEKGNRMYWFYLKGDDFMQRTHAWNTKLPSCRGDYGSGKTEEVAGNTKKKGESYLILQSQYEINVELSKAYRSRKNFCTFCAVLEDDMQKNQQLVLDCVKRWFANHRDHKSYHIRVYADKADVDIEYR